MFYIARMHLLHSLAMYKPGSWVVGGKAHDQPAAGRKKRGIAARWVIELEASFAAIPDAGTLTDDIVIWSIMSVNFGTHNAREGRVGCGGALQGLP